MAYNFREYFAKKYPSSAYIYNVLKKNGDQDIVWEDLTDTFMDNVADTIKENVCPSSARTYLTVIRSLLNRARLSGITFPSVNYAEILRAKSSKCSKTYLTTEELRRIEVYIPPNDYEATVRARFLIGAYTGCRQSDFRQINASNIQDGMLSYVSEKTGIKATIPVKPIVKELIRIPCKEMPLATFNSTLRNICRKCGIRTMVKVFKGGKQMEGPKYKFISSHTARISFCTNLYLLGCDIVKVSRMAGHSDINMTKRYIASEMISIDKKAMRYFH